MNAFQFEGLATTLLADYHLSSSAYPVITPYPSHCWQFACKTLVARQQLTNTHKILCTHSLTPQDEGVQILEEISEHLKLQKLRYSTSSFRTVSWWACLLIMNVTVAILLSSQCVYAFLSSYYLHWVSTILCGLLGALSMFRVVANFSGIYMFMSLEANVTEIATLLKYNQSLRLEELYKRNDMINTS